jgi:hypothetical protein
LVDSDRVYRRSYGMIWLCEPCDADVGCHKNSPTHAPLGTPATLHLRRLRQRVHKDLDAIWRDGLVLGCDRAARSKTYAWLAVQLGLPKERCHVAEFDEDMCERAINVLKQTTWEKVASHEHREFKEGDVVVITRGGESHTGVIEQRQVMNDETMFQVKMDVKKDGLRAVWLVPDSDLEHAPIVDAIARLGKTEA